MEQEREDQSAALEPLGDVGNDRGLSPAAYRSATPQGAAAGFLGLLRSPAGGLCPFWAHGVRETRRRDVSAHCARGLRARPGRTVRDLLLFLFLAFAGFSRPRNFCPACAGSYPPSCEPPISWGLTLGGACRAVYCAHFGHMNRLNGSHFVRFSLCAHLHAHKAFIFYICSILPRPRGACDDLCVLPRVGRGQPAGAAFERDRGYVQRSRPGFSIQRRIARRPRGARAGVLLSCFSLV